MDTVRNLVDSATGGISKNEYFAVDEQNAQGLSSRDQALSGS